MKRSISVLIVALLLLAPISQVSAQTETTDNLGSYTADARSARIASLRQTYKIVLSEKEKQSLQARCQGAQKSLSSVADRFDDVRVRRESVYRKTIVNLTSLRAVLLASQTDTSSLDLLIVQYQQKLADFNEASDSYDLVLSDIVTMDCVLHPEDFRAVLEGVRLARKELVSVSAQIKETTNSSLKNTFDIIELKLNADTSDGR
jgi:hypothetical protein